jgi:hypothetical protein
MLTPGEAFRRIPLGYLAFLILAVGVVEIVHRLRVTRLVNGAPAVSALLLMRFTARRSADGLLHECGDPCLVRGGQLLQSEFDRPHRAFVEIGRVAEA